MDSKKSMFRKIRDWAEAPVAGSGAGKKKKDDYCDIFGEKLGEKKDDYSDIFDGEREEKKDDYSDIFVKTASNMKNLEEMIDQLTFENVTDFYFEAKEQLKSIYKCVIQLTEKKDVASQVYCVDQYFIDREERIIYSEDEPKKRQGRTVYAKKLDKQLITFLKQKNPFIF